MHNHQSLPKSQEVATARQRYLPVVILDGDDRPAQVQTYGIAELASLYGVHRHTFVKWMVPFLNDLTERGYVPGDRKLKPACVRVVFERLGEP